MLKFEHDLCKKWILCIILAVLPTWHKTNINLCRYLMLTQMTSLQLPRSSQNNILICAAFSNLNFLVDFFVDRAKGMNVRWITTIFLLQQKLKQLLLVMEQIDLIWFT